MPNLLDRFFGNNDPAAQQRLAEQARLQAEWEQRYGQKVQGLEQPAFDPADILAGGITAAPKGLLSVLGSMGVDAATGLALDQAPPETLLASVASPKVASKMVGKATKRFMQPQVNTGLGTIQTKPIGGTLYRETDAEGMGDLISDLFANTPERGKITSKFFTDDLDLAIGQYGKKGVKMKLNGDFISGQEHVKPGTGIVGGREFKSDFIGRDAIEEFTLPKGVKTSALARRFTKQHFDREVLPNGDRVFRRKPE